MGSEFDKHRKRRLIYNDDADQLYQYPEGSGYDYRIVDDASFIDARTTPVFDTHVDTYAWCVGNGADPAWGRMNQGSRGVVPCLGSEWRAADLIIDACHARGIEVWASLRMNDIHDSFMVRTLEETNDPLKAEHPEWLICTTDERDRFPDELTERYLWSAWNFEHQGLRDYRLAFIEKTASEHDFDGYDLDFTRFVWNFPMGREIALAPVMTDFVRQARERLNAVGKRRGRPYTLVVHVMDSPEKSLLLGQDAEAWVEEGLVDVLTVGMGYLPYALALDEWNALGAKHGVPVYPSLNTNTFIEWYKARNGPARFQRDSAWLEAIRAAAAWWWANGADGINLFNLYCLEHSEVGRMARDLVYRPLREAGDPAVLSGLDKLYGIAPSSRGGFCHHGSEATPLPIPLEPMERKLTLAIGPDVDARFTLHFWTTGGGKDVTVYARLNHTLLAPVLVAKRGEKDTDDHYAADVPAGIVHAGRNELTLWCSQPLREAGGPMVCHEVLVEARYA